MWVNCLQTFEAKIFLFFANHPDMLNTTFPSI
jgi:hypothetical protein